MTNPTLPLLVEPDTLEKSLDCDNVVIVDLSRHDNYRKLHVPGAVHLDYVQIVSMHKPVLGLLPDDSTLERLFGATGIQAGTHVVAYDDEGGGRAARLLWTLETAGHGRYSLLNGGLHAWANEGHRFESTATAPQPGTFTVQHDERAIARSDYIHSRLHDDRVCLLDVRSPDEYSGVKKLAQRGGHIPGAVNLEWTRALDTTRNLRLRPAAELRTLLEGIGATPQREVIVYCHSHHRSAHTWFVLKYLGYHDVRGYPGSWSDWGNDPALPVQQGGQEHPSGAPRAD
jgi:thiosulfate/3-mercaptopyruvate sulfurtransferase